MKWMVQCLLLFLWCYQAAAEDKVFRLNSGAPESLSNDHGTAFYNRLAAEMFKRMGMRHVYIRLPSQRALIQANNGSDDGNIARIDGMEKKWKNLVKVPESILTWEFTAYTNRDDIHINGWDSLKPYTVGHVRGWQIYEKKSAVAKQAIRANNPRHLFAILKNKRIDVALFEHSQSRYWFDKIGYHPRRLSPALVKKPLFIYVHKKHSSLVPKMAAELASMKKDGRYRLILNDTLLKQKGG